MRTKSPSAVTVVRPLLRRNHDPGGKVAEGYKNLTKEVLKLEKQREKSRAGIGR